MHLSPSADAITCSRLIALRAILRPDTFRLGLAERDDADKTLYDKGGTVIGLFTEAATAHVEVELAGVAPGPLTALDFDL